MIDGYIINLEHRTDRKEHIINDLKDTIINPIIIPAIKDKHGWIGCLKSHLKIIQIAKDKNMDFVLVIEDDNVIVDKTTFNDKFKIIIDYLSKNLDKWQIFNGSAGLCEKGTKLINKYNVQNIDILEVQICISTNFIIYNKSVYDFLLSYNNLIKKKIKRTYKIDLILSRKLNTLLTYPQFCKQLNNTISDVLQYQRNDIDNIYITSDIVLRRFLQKK